MRYFIDIVTETERLIDEIGGDFTSLVAARTEAIKSAREMFWKKRSNLRKQARSARNFCEKRVLIQQFRCRFSISGIKMRGF